MYTHIWNKYLPVIRILLKKSATGNQTLDLNRIDFERDGSARKAGYKFNIEFEDGKVANVISGSDLASHLSIVMLEDAIPDLEILLGQIADVLALAVGYCRIDQHQPRIGMNGLGVCQG